MKRASRHFTEAQRQGIAEAVAKAESETSAEIVPVVATVSGRYDRGEDLAGVMIAIIALVLAWTFFQHENPDAGGWGSLPITLGLPWLVGIIMIGFFIGMGLAMKVAWLRRLFTPGSEMGAEVEARARQLFFDHRIHHTASETGVLIYISLFERRAVMLADRTVMAQLDQAELDGMCGRLVTDLKTGAVAEALVRNIEQIGTRLAETLPADESDRNELGDALILLD